MRAHTHPIMRPTAVIVGALLILAATLTATAALEAESAHTLTIHVAGDGSGSVAVSPMGSATGSAFSGGDYHTCAIRGDATLLCWGSNGDGQTDVPAGSYIAVAAGGQHTCAIRTDETLDCWGGNFAGQSDAPAGTYTAVAAGSLHSCAIATDASIACWGDNEFEQSDPPAGSFSAIAVGYAHACAITTEGALTCWGWNVEGQTDAPAGSFTAAAAGGGYTCAIGDDAALECWGRNLEGQTDAPPGSFGTVAAGIQHACAVATDGAVACWGRNLEGQTDAPAGAFRAVAAGSWHSCAIASAGAITCWGNNDFGQTDAPAGSFLPSGGLVYPEGTAVTLTATADPGSTFAGWSGDCAGTEPTCDLTMDADRTVTAIFGLESQNQPPSIQPIADVTMDEGTTEVIDIVASDPDDDPLTVSVDGLPDFGSFDPAGLTITLSPVFDDAGEHGPVSVEVTDGALTSQTSFSITVTDSEEPNTTPVADAAGPYELDEGSTVQLDGTGSTDADGTIATYAWSPDTNLDDASLAQPTYTGLDDTLDELTLTVTDDDGASDDDTTTVTVHNVAPSVEAGADQAITLGDSVSLDPATFSDSGTADTHTASIDWGDGTIEPGSLTQGAGSGTIDGSYTYAGTGTYTVTVTVTDDDGGSHADSLTVTVTEAPPPTPLNKLLASDGAGSDWFGWSVATSGDRIVVGAPNDDDGGTNNGSAYVYEPNGAGGWNETKLVASDGAGNDSFGYAVAISGDRIVVGAPNDDDDGTSNGSAYVFEPDGAGGWSDTKLVASDRAGGAGGRFGFSVAVASDRIVVGAFNQDDNGPGSGSAYVFEPDGAGGWVETKLVASDGAAGDVFGQSVAIAGDRIVVGARLDDDNGGNSGSAYLFEPNGAGGWSETKLVASDGAGSDWFGWSVATSGDRILVGARNDDSRGSAYVFVPDGAGGWSESKLRPGVLVGAEFGYSVAVAGDRMVVGARIGGNDGHGSAYVFEADGAGGWSETKLLASDGAAGDWFGNSVAVTGHRVVIGAPQDDDRGTDSGSAYVFEVDATDTNAPEITVPDDIVVEAINPDGAVVEYEAAVTDDTDPAPSLACEPTSGSVFPIGETEVLCTATDASDNVAEASFTITVTLGEEAFDGFIEIVEELRLPGGTERSIVRQIENAQRDFLAGDLDGALEKLNDLLDRVNGLEGRRLTGDQAAELRRLLEQLTAAISDMHASGP